MRKNRIKLITEWKQDSVLSYHKDQVKGSFRIDKMENESLKFLNTCWIKKWNDLNELKQADPEIIKNIITISIGGMFINTTNLSNQGDHIKISCVKLTQLLNLFHNGVYLSLVNLYLTIQKIKC